MFDYLPDDTAIYVSERDDVRAHAQKVVEQIAASYAEVADAKEEGPPDPGMLFIDWQEADGQFAHATELSQLAVGETDRDPASLHIGTQPAPEFRGRIADWAAEVRRARERGETVLFVAAGVGRAERTVELLAEYELRGVQLDRADDIHSAAVLVATGDLSRGFRLPAAELQVFAESDVFEEDRRQAERRRSLAKTFLSDLRDLKEGDLVVHVDHGIGKFVGLKQIALGAGSAVTQEFRSSSTPARTSCSSRSSGSILSRIQRCHAPALDRLGGASWERAKRGSARPCGTWPRSC